LEKQLIYMVEKQLAAVTEKHHSRDFTAVAAENSK
jgi:hypothetical protein